MTAADANAAFREQLALQRDRGSRATALAARLGLAPDVAEEDGGDDPPGDAA